MSACPMATRGMVNSWLLELNLFLSVRNEKKRCLDTSVWSQNVHEILSCLQPGATRFYSFIHVYIYIYIYLGGVFKYFLCSPLFGEDFQFDYYLSDGLKPPTRYTNSICFLDIGTGHVVLFLHERLVDSLVVNQNWDLSVIRSCLGANAQPMSR